MVMRWARRLRLKGKSLSPRELGEELPADAAARAAFLRQFAGFWIAIDRGRVIAAEETGDNLFAKLKGMGVKGARVRRIPHDIDAVHVGLG